MLVRPPSYHLLATGQVDPVSPPAPRPRPAPAHHRSAGSYLPRFRHHRRRRTEATTPTAIPTAR